MVDIPMRKLGRRSSALTGEFATVGVQGVYVNGKLMYWADLIDALYAASQCCREGSKRHDDLFQSAYSYLPSLVNQFQSDDPEDAVTFCGMDRPNPGEND
jgi:hypothetical protein